MKDLKRPFFSFVLIFALTFSLLNNTAVQSKQQRLKSTLGVQSGGGGKTTTVPSPNDPTYDTWCHDLSSSSIYTLGSKLNCSDNSQAFSMGLMVAVFFTVCIEIAVHTLDHHVRNFVTKEIINKVYRELMMMGFISFGINVLESVHLFELIFQVLNDSSVEESAHEITERRVMIFELVHICLFVLSIIYVIAVVICYYIVRRTWHKWNKFELMEKKEKGFIVRRYLELSDQFKRSNIILKVLNVKLWYDYSCAVERMGYFTIKQRFLKANKLSSSFRFDIYLKTRIRKLFLQLIDIGVEAWAAIFLIAMANYVRIKIVDLNSGGNGLWGFFILLGVLPFLLAAVLYIICRTGYSFYHRTHAKKAALTSLTISTGQDLGSNLLDGENTETQVEEEEDRTEAQEEYPEPSHESLSLIDYDFDMRKYFPFKQPKILFYFLQGILIAHSFYVAMLIIHFLNVSLNENVISHYKVLNVFVYFLLYSPSVLVLVIFFPYTMAPLTLLTSVENFSSHKTIVYAVLRAEALIVRADIEKVMENQPEYHPLRKKIKKALAHHFPVLHEHGDFEHEPYFVQTSHNKKKRSKQLHNLIQMWNKRMKELKDAKFRASRRETVTSRPARPDPGTSHIVSTPVDLSDYQEFLPDDHTEDQL